MHPCPVPGCEVEVKAIDLMCKRHWRLVPPPIKQAVIRAWLKADREMHLAAVKRALQAVVEAEARLAQPTSVQEAA